MMTDEVVDLLRTTSLTHSQIGKRVGCARELVRQIDLKVFKRTGRQRRAERPVVKVVIPNAVTKKVAEKALQAGCAVAYQGSNRLSVNGSTVRVHSVDRYYSSGGDRRYLHVSARNVGAMFYVVYDSIHDRVFVIPHGAIPDSRTIYIPEEPNLPAYNNQKSIHNWFSYLDAWHLISI